jgi:two-component system OmpR family sensor kinase
MYRFVVEDDGEGIPESDRTSTFRAFTRLDNSRNRDTGGFGLGLAIVARIASLHRGRVTAESSVSLGGAKLALEWPGAS